eukprot:TRINITY_DN2405_c0_g1_i1.p2 TRINITY_DN2405_c0_g1~~TRINITY_DN2405_c0_g1_i1.p2  ORF type:complete len:101 (-),score=7.75 TRINITY_DN2405_c0_g1_i1:111-413(-)
MTQVSAKPVVLQEALELCSKQLRNVAVGGELREKGEPPSIGLELDKYRLVACVAHKVCVSEIDAFSKCIQDLKNSNKCNGPSVAMASCIGDIKQHLKLSV